MAGAPDGAVSKTRGLLRLPRYGEHRRPTVIEGPTSQSKRSRVGGLAGQPKACDVRRGGLVSFLVAHRTIGLRQFDPILSRMLVGVPCCTHAPDETPGGQKQTKFWIYPRIFLPFSNSFFFVRAQTAWLLFYSSFCFRMCAEPHHTLTHTAAFLVRVNKHQNSPAPNPIKNPTKSQPRPTSCLCVWFIISRPSCSRAARPGCARRWRRGSC